MASSRKPDRLNDLFPKGANALLAGSGAQFVERLGIEAIKTVVHRVMLGQNLRAETEPLSRRRITLVSGALINLFARGHSSDRGFAKALSRLAVNQLVSASTADKGSVWIAQWMIGQTGKGVQNILRGNPEELQPYVDAFESTIQDAAKTCEAEYGRHSITITYTDETGKERDALLDWEAIVRLTTAIGCQTLAIRGSDKSLYGKLFERLILGSVLSVLGFKHVSRDQIGRAGAEKVFWLSDSSASREADATMLLSPGNIARFDIGFIGVGNSEISKDKLSRFEREHELNGRKHASTTFIVVDRLPRTGKTEQAARRIGAEIIQMSMHNWVQELAQKLHQRMGYRHPLATMQLSKCDAYLKTALKTVNVAAFVSGGLPTDDGSVDADE